MIRTFLILFVCCVFACNVHGQEIIQLSSGDYKYQEKIYKYKEMSLVMIQDQLAHKTYRHANTNLKAARILGTISLVSFGIGAIGLTDTNDMYCDLWCITTGQAIAIITWGFVVPATGTAGLITRAVGQHLKKKSIDQFNGVETNGFIDTHQKYWAFGISRNGVGLTYNF